jgi:hypothetical protein
MKKRAAVPFAVLCTAVFGCGGMIAAQTPRTVLLPSPSRPPMVRGAIVRALAVQRYEAEADEPGRIVARYERRGTRYRVEIAYTATQYSIRYVDSQGVDVERDEETGQLMIDGAYGRWIGRLERSIRDELARPGREQAAAVAAARQHELALANAAAERERLRLEAEREANRPVVIREPAPPVVGLPVPVPMPVPAPVQIGGGVHVQRQVTNRQSTQALTCCINGAFYSCPGQEAFESCLSTGPSMCTREPARDGQCR